MTTTASAVFMTIGLIVIGAVQAYCDEPPGKRRVPWETREHNQWVQEQTAKRMFSGKTMRDPFKEPRPKYIPDCQNPKKRILYPEFMTTQRSKEGDE